MKDIKNMKKSVVSKFSFYLFRAVAVILFVLAYSTIHAQTKNGSITGTVVDNSGPLNESVIRVLKMSDSSFVAGGYTDSLGNYSVKVPYGNFKVEASFTGYRKTSVTNVSVTSSNPSVKLQQIKLQSSDISTEEIVVESEKPIVEITAEKKVINMDNALVTKGESAIDLLKRVPMVTVDNSNNIILRGSPNVKLLINGKESALSDNLDQLPADLVKSVELVTNPPAKYESEGLAGIINIVLKDETNIGLNGGINIGASTNERYNGALNFNVKKGPWSLFGNYFYNNGYNQSTSSSNLINNLNTTTYTNENDISSFRRRFQYVSTGIEYKIDPQQSVSFQGSFGFGKGIGGDIGQNYILDNNQNLTSYFTKDNNSVFNGNHFSLSLNYDGKYKSGSQLTGNASFSRGKFDNSLNQVLQYYDGNYVPVNNTPYTENDTRNSSNYHFNTQLDYTKPFTKNSKLELGYKGVIRQSDNNFVADTLDYGSNQFVENYGSSNEFKYKEQIYGLYAQYSNQFGNFGFSLGLRGEQTFTDGTLINDGTEYKTNYFGLFPTLNLTEKIGNFEQIQASYSRRINRPNQFRINPFVNRTDPLNLVYGNPNLKPEYTDSYELNFVTSFGNTTITPSLFLRRTKDLMTRYTVQTDSNVTVSTFENLASSTSYGLDLIVSTQPAKWLNFNSTLSFYNLKYEGGNIDNFTAPSGFTFKGNASTIISLPNLFNMQLFYNYYGKQYTSQGTTDPLQSFDIGVSKNFLDNSLTVLLKANDVFNTMKNASYISGLGFIQNSTSSSNTRNLQLTLSYNFGKRDKSDYKKKKNNDSKDPDMDEGM